MLSVGSWHQRLRQHHFAAASSFGWTIASDPHASHRSGAISGRRWLVAITRLGFCTAVSALSSASLRAFCSFMSLKSRAPGYDTLVPSACTGSGTRATADGFFAPTPSRRLGTCPTGAVRTWVSPESGAGSPSLGIHRRTLVSVVSTM